MMTIVVLLMVAAIFNILFCVNPVKLSANLIVLSVTVMSIMFLATGCSLLPTLLLLLYTGGILMVFLILSSFMPNEKPKKFYPGYLALLAMMIYWLESLVSTPQYSSVSAIKWSVESSLSSITITILILIYFMSFLEVIQGDRLPMRTS